MKRFCKNNQGVALITVVVGVMFCLLLTSTMLRVSLLGLQSRSINNQVSDNFYDAESVVDTIRLNIQNVAAKAWKTSSNDVGNSTNYIKQTYSLLTGGGVCTAGTTTFSTTDSKYTSVIQNLEANAKLGGSVQSFSSIEVVANAGKFTELIVHDVEVKYENPKTKMVSYVKTDIRIKAPLYASTDDPPLASYSMFIGTGAAIGGSNMDWNHNCNKIGYLEQEGNVYIGYTGNWNNGSPDALTVNCRNTCIFSGDSVVINGNVRISEEATFQVTGKKVDVRGKIYIDTKCHLVVGDHTKLNCQDILIKTGSEYKSISEIQFNGTKKYDKGEPKNYYGSTNWNDFQYHNNAASIVYLESPDNGETYTGKGYDATISNGNVKKQGGASLSGAGHIYCAPDDPNLQARERRSDGYDQRFAEIIDVDYFKKYMDKNNAVNGDGPNNNKIKAEVKDSITLNGNKKYTPTSTGLVSTSLSGGEDAKKIVLKSKGSPATDLYTCLMSVGNNQGNSQNVNPGNANSGNFIITDLDLKVRMNAVGDRYSGVYITSGNLWIEKNEGLTVGESLLDYAVRKNADLKTFIDTVGKQTYIPVGSGSADQIKYAIINNMFNGGIQVFYKTENYQGSSSVMADEDNAKMNLVDFENYEKH